MVCVEDVWWNLTVPVPLPDLTNLSAVEAWENEQREAKWTAEAFIAAYEAVGSPLALLRCVPHTVIFGAEQYAKASTYARQALGGTTDPAIRLMASASMTIDLMYEARTQGLDEASGGFAVIHALERQLYEAQILQSNPLLGLEVEFRVSQALTVAYHQTNQPQKAVALASRGVQLAYLLGAPRSINNAKVVYSMALHAQGALFEALRMRLSMTRDTGLDRVRMEEAVIASSILMANIGQDDNAIAALQSLQGAGVHYRAAAWQQFVEALYGKASLDEPVITQYRWQRGNKEIVEALLGMIESSSKAPTRQLDERRESLLRTALQTLGRHDWERLDGDRALVKWMRSWIYLHLGECGLLQREVLGGNVGHEELSTRLLMVAARLELAAQIGEFKVEGITQTEEEARAIFSLAREHASVTARGLADLVTYWHPLAAAYLHLMPGGIPELREATDAVVRVNERHTAYGLTLPPAFATEQFLREFNVRLDALLPTPLNKMMRVQRDRLLVARGKAMHFRPIISSAKLAYLLLKAEGTSERRNTAKAVMALGGMPKLRSDFAEVELQFMTAQLASLLAGEQTVTQFDQEVLRFTQ